VIGRTFDLLAHERPHRFRPGQVLRTGQSIDRLKQRLRQPDDANSRFHFHDRSVFEACIVACLIRFRKINARACRNTPDSWVRLPTPKKPCKNVAERLTETG
jgi:hypothetical protein